MVTYRPMVRKENSPANQDRQHGHLIAAQAERSKQHPYTQDYTRLYKADVAFASLHA